MTINWFPGHMAKTITAIKNDLKLVDAVIEMRDARIVKSSANPDIDEICKNKPRIILLNKCDLSEKKVNNEWMEYLSNINTRVIPLNSNNGEGIRKIKPALDELLKEKHERLKNKGLAKITDRVMVVGIPNVGKSTFINKMAKGSIAKVGDRPGVTKSKQWIKTQIGIELMDTPGILWPKFEDEETGLNLAFTGAIKDEIMDIEDIGFKLLEKLIVLYPQNVMNRYKLTSIEEDVLINLNNIALKRGAIISGGEIDYNRICNLILDEFRGGKIGNISLERP